MKARKATAREIKDALAIPTQVEPVDAMEEVWPHLEVQAYSRTGRKVEDEKEGYELLEVMHPFSAFYRPKGALFGFTQSFSLDKGTMNEVSVASGTDTTKLLRLRVVKGTTAKLKIVTKMHLAPVEQKPPEPDKPDPGQRAEDCVKSDPWCSYSPKTRRTPAGGLLVIVAMTGLCLARRRRGRA